MPSIYGSNNFCAKGAKYECSDIGFMYSHISKVYRDIGGKLYCDYKVF